MVAGQSPRGYPVCIEEPQSVDKVDRMTQLVYGHDVKLHAIGIPLSANDGDPDEQAAAYISNLFREANEGNKPHLLPEAERLLRLFKAHKHRETLTHAVPPPGGKSN